MRFGRRRDATDIPETAGVAVGIAVPPRSDALVGTSGPAGAMDELDRRLVVVEERLTAAAGDRSLCELSRDGGSEGLKELEGRMSALFEARRNVGQSFDALGTVIEVVLDAWRAELVNDSNRSAAWRSYRAGGIDELEALLRSLQHGDLEFPPAP